MSNFERVEMLFNIVEAAAKHGPLYSAISTAASAELKALNDEATKDQQAKAKAEAEEVAKAKAAQTAEERAAAERDAKRIFPQGSGVKEEHDTPTVQRKV